MTDAPQEKESFMLSTDRVEVADVSHRNHWRRLAVQSPEGDVVGSWTMIYDEGVEVRLPNLTLTFLLKYSRTSGESCHAIRDDDAEDAAGQTDCYRTDPKTTLIGWYQRGDVYGCAFGQRSGDDDRDGGKPTLISKKRLHSPIPMRHPRATQRATAGPLMPQGAYLRDTKDHPRNSSSLPELWQRGKWSAHAFLLQDKASGGSAMDVTGRGRACQSVNTLTQATEDIPPQFSWGDPWIAPEKLSKNDHSVINQVRVDRPGNSA
eukprot:Blabericola_migrator_1__4127@NODE_225_length_11139_cov_51_682262_g191_i0_p4_GENE_NODE_225_length_11139_cov_51_682262_g191_i0NODE_225_length_11139_cov_51_682262_g191_i0_p4_ORF_typecomplete_len263_score27_25CathepsinC_exc/PF08773_11/9_3e15_NODE_225_length_11139_cov_51_682262_g191_i013142102